MADAGVSGTGRDGLVRSLWLLSALFIVYGTTLPFAFDGASPVAARLAHVSQTTPWALHAADRLSIPDVVQNILLFVPFGLFGFMARQRDGRAGGLMPVVAVTALGALLSTGVEVLQLFTDDRIASLTDVATNSAGAAGGALAALLGRDVGLRLLGKLGRAGLLDGRTFYPVLVFLGVLCLAAWQPFDVTLDVGTVGHKVRLLLRDPWQFDGINDEGTALLQAALFSGAVCAWLAALKQPRPMATGAALAVACTAALEGSQAFIGARQPGVLDAVVRAVGCCAGAALWRLGQPGGLGRTLLQAVAVGTAAAVALQMLAPFEWAGRYQPVQWIPFLNYYAYTSFATVSHTIELLLLYLPLGFVAGAASARRTRLQAFGTATVLSLTIAAPVEYAQGWIAGRYPDVTDVALSVAGACVGVWAAIDGAAIFASLSATVGGRSTRG